MAKIEMPVEHLTDYERAICYYTIPKVTRPVTLGLLVAYVVCLLEAAFLLLYGLLTKNDLLVTSGVWALGGIVVLGLGAFLFRAFMNELKQRKALAVAKGVPDAIEDIDDIPDPFAENILLRHPLYAKGDLFPCTDDSGKLLYFVESSAGSHWWKIRDPHDQEIVRVRVESNGGSFLFSESFPRCLSVFEGTEIIARLRRRFTLSSPYMAIECRKPELKTYVLENDGIYLGNRLVGRIYFMHHSIYLDIESKDFHPAILSLFAVMT
jgi:hypothetical protein